MAQLISITSEALQASIRRLLPSQQGFGEDLQASNVVTPIIDLTPTAEGSALPDYLQTAVTFTDATVFSSNNSSTVIANTPGFWRIYGGVGVKGDASANQSARLDMSDGLSTKKIWGLTMKNADATYAGSVVVDLVVLLSSGDSVTAVTSGNGAFFEGSARQIATIQGTLVDPTGYTPQ